MAAMSLAIVPPLVLIVTVYDGKSSYEGESGAHTARNLLEIAFGRVAHLLFALLLLVVFRLGEFNVYHVAFLVGRVFFVHVADEEAVVFVSSRDARSGGELDLSKKEEEKRKGLICDENLWAVFEYAEYPRSLRAIGNSDHVLTRSTIGE
jgi:hypothetical protein